MHHQQEAQPVAPCGDADVFVLRVEQQISRLHLVPRYSTAGFGGGGMQGDSPRMRCTASGSHKPSTAVR